MHTPSPMRARARAALAAAHVPLEDPIPGTIPPGAVRIALHPVHEGLVSPVAAAVAPGDHAHLYVADQPGQIWRIPLHGGTARVWLDLAYLLVPLGLPPSQYDERGLLGLAFHPDYLRNGLFYTFTSQPALRPADFSTQPPGVPPDCQSVITEWRVQRNGLSVDAGSARELMRIDKPQFNHNGGALAFGRDGMLYVSVGDGGSADDQGPGHAPGGNAQDLSPHNVLGKILRIDPLGTNAVNGSYGIPADNPFARGGAAPEVWAYGFRNPFRMSFDRRGRLWVGDVGQNDIEEVDIVVRGGNHGWRIKEGTFLFDPNGTGPGFVYEDSPGRPRDLVDPVAEYDHADGPDEEEAREAVIGGFVYRGRAVSALRGTYVFGDYSGEDAATGHLFMLTPRGEVRELVAVNRDPLHLAVLGFGEDHAGEMYLLANGTGTLSGRTGVVLRFASPRHGG